MSYSARMQRNHLYSVHLAPRGYPRMVDSGAQIAQQYLSPFDLLIGVIGEAGSGKSMLIKGMFPGLELTNDDEGVNVRPLPILDLDDTGFFSPHMYHLDIRFESAFTQMHVLASAIKEALSRGKRVIVEHFDLIYPLLQINAHLLIGVGEEMIITRPNFFGPEPRMITDIVFKTIDYRRMSHSAEDLCEMYLKDIIHPHFDHLDVRHGFILNFIEKPKFDISKMAEQVRKWIEADLEISYKDHTHVTIGDQLHYCTGPRMHVTRTSEIKNFELHKEFLHEPITNRYMLVGMVGSKRGCQIHDLNTLNLKDI